MDKSPAGSPGLAGSFAEALGHYQLGRLADAERLCGQILAATPSRHEALHLLGLVAARSGHAKAASELIAQAISLRDDVADYHFNFGLLLQQAGDLDAATVSFERASSLREGFVDAHNNLAVLHLLQGRLDRAAAGFERVLRLQPDRADVACNLGVVLQQLGRPEAAVAQFERSLALRPNYPEAAYNLGVAFERQGRAIDAIAPLEQALSLRPDYAEAAQALSLVLNNLGVALHGEGRLNEAIGYHERALALQPDHANMRLTLSLARLACGELDEGWRLYEARWLTDHFDAMRRRFDAPRWNGSTGSGGTILIWAEQGFGDTLQFCRYAPLVAQRGWRVVVEVQPMLVRLMQSLADVTVVPIGATATSNIDCHCPMMSLPLLFETTLETIPAAMPYLAPAPDDVRRWRRVLTRSRGDRPAGLTVGLCWAGNPRTDSPVLSAVDARRSMALDQLAPLFTVEGVRFVSLQKELGQADDPARYAMLDPMGEVEDFADTAAIISALDLVIAVDTSVAHLAGALGKPVWLLNRFDTCWRWLRGRTDSLWYPTLRQFRQEAFCSWDNVIAEAATELSALAVSPRPLK